VIVNLHNETVESWFHLANSEGTTLTEALTRAVTRQHFLDREVRQGNIVLLQNPATRQLRQVTFNFC